MLEWTGERYLPWLKEATVAYEHLHRYVYALQFAKGHRVLDLACGEGYGANMLARTAVFVLGVDIDLAVIRHATAKYTAPNLQFVSGSIAEIPALNASFDVIVCFEAIEHIEEQEKLLAEAKRLLAPGGIFIVSTPNRAVYRDEAQHVNPFHVRELYFDEFKQLLSRYFRHTTFLGQRVHPGSSIWPIDDRPASRFHETVIERRNSEFQIITNRDRAAVYFIAIASDSTDPLPNRGSVLLDHSNELISEIDTAIQKALIVKEQQLRNREETIEWQQQQIQELNEGLAWTKKCVEDLKRTAASHGEALEWRAGQVRRLEQEYGTLTRSLEDTSRKLAAATEQLEAIHMGTGWKIIVTARRIRDSLFPPGSSRRRFFDWVMGLVRPRAVR